MSDEADVLSEWRDELVKFLCDRIRPGMSRWYQADELLKLLRPLVAQRVQEAIGGAYLAAAEVAWTNHELVQRCVTGHCNCNKAVAERIERLTDKDSLAALERRDERVCQQIAAQAPAENSAGGELQTEGQTLAGNGGNLNTPQDSLLERVQEALKGIK